MFYGLILFLVLIALLAGWLVWLFAAAVFVGLMVWQVRDLRLAVGIALAVFAALATLMGAGHLMLRLLDPLLRTGGTAALGLAALARYPQLTLLQLAGFGLGITLILLLAVVRVDIIDTWQANLPEDAPNHFLINVQPDERAALQALLDDAADRDEAAQVRIEALGSQLNVALARAAAEERRRAELEEAERLRLEEEARRLTEEAQELERYRSEFFGQLRDVLGDVLDVEDLGQVRQADHLEAGEAEVSQETVEVLRALGYIR